VRGEDGVGSGEGARKGEADSGRRDEGGEEENGLGRLHSPRMRGEGGIDQSPLSPQGPLPTLKCTHCPIATEVPCPGEHARRLCHLIDPAHSNYMPGYVASIRDHALRLGVGRRGDWRAKIETGPPLPPLPKSDQITPTHHSLAESLKLIAAMRECLFRSIDPGCGCAGARCSLRQGSVVSYLDCFDCLRRFGVGTHVKPEPSPGEREGGNGLHSSGAPAPIPCLEAGWP
jgi:hypothetical protein